MKRHKLKKKWKVLICLLLIAGIFIYKNKTSNAEVEQVETKVARTNRVTIEEQKKDEPVVEEQPKEEETEPVKEYAEVGFFPNIETFNVEFKGSKHSSSGYKFYMDEDIDINITSEYPEGNIYIIKHGGEIKESYTYGETIKETIFNNSVFFINYEEGNIGYYDVVFVSNNIVLGHATIELVE